MVRKLKDTLYFIVAHYFRFFAHIRLSRWHPRVVVVTGSNGKTTTLHLIEYLLGPGARYSHGANSSFGIPFDILELKRKSYSVLEWPLFALLAPVRALRTPPQQRVYVVEADCDRPYEGAFLCKLLAPEAVVWLSSDRTHSMNYDRAVLSGEYKNVDEAIAHEYGHFARAAQKLLIINADNALIVRESEGTPAVVCGIRRSNVLESYGATLRGSEFGIAGSRYALPYLLPEETFYSLFAGITLARYFGREPSDDFSRLVLPPGRSSVFEGIKGTTLIDSTYNANAASVGAIVRAVQRVAGEKWLVLGDMVEQGKEESEEHEKVARLVAESNFQRIILVGPRMKRYALPLIARASSFDVPKDALDHIESSITGGEVIVFKGARFLEGLVEHLLADPHDASKLPRREEVWRKRRKEWDL